MGRVIPLLSVCWLAWCANTSPNMAPLAFGMTPREAAAALSMPLMYPSGRRGSEILYAVGPESIPGFYPTDIGARPAVPPRPPPRLVAGLEPTPPVAVLTYAWDVPCDGSPLRP
jgi:hypothetical protein